MRLVLDTCVLVAATRSDSGVSKPLVDFGLEGRFTPLVSVPLVLEYEAVLTRPEHLEASGLTATDAIALVKAFCLKGEPVHLSYRLRPQLNDPGDEFVLETAFHGRAKAIVTFNRKDFDPSARRFGIEILSPVEVMNRIKRP